jgi:hypothetical protein
MVYRCLAMLVAVASPLRPGVVRSQEPPHLEIGQRIRGYLPSLGGVTMMTNSLVGWIHEIDSAGLVLQVDEGPVRFTNAAYRIDSSAIARLEVSKPAWIARGARVKAQAPGTGLLDFMGIITSTTQDTAYVAPDFLVTPQAIPLHSFARLEVSLGPRSAGTAILFGLLGALTGAALGSVAAGDIRCPITPEGIGSDCEVSGSAPGAVIGGIVGGVGGALIARGLGKERWVDVPMEWRQLDCSPPIWFCTDHPIHSTLSASERQTVERLAQAHRN